MSNIKVLKVWFEFVTILSIVCDVVVIVFELRGHLDFAFHQIWWI